MIPPQAVAAPTKPVEPPLVSSESIQLYATQTALDADIDPTEVYKIIQCESNWDVKAVGDHGTSFGLVQIHLPAHTDITVEQAENPKFAIQFLVRNLKAGNKNIWTCARTL